ncbi:MAG: transposase [Bradyrhizobium sp.]
MTLVERGGSARSFHIDATTLNEVTKLVRESVHHETIVNTDEGVWYNQVGAHFLSHETFSRYEYARDDITTNAAEGYYSIFKRGMKGVYQHCSEKHLHRHLSEFDFRYSNRVALAVNLIKYDFKRMARRFLRWRAKIRKPPPRFVKYWRTT